MPGARPRLRLNENLAGPTTPNGPLLRAIDIPPAVVGVLQDAGLVGEVGLDVLVEVHDRAELDRALELATPLIGINNRNLKTFDVTLDTTRILSKRVPEDRQIVCESGLFTPEDLADMARYGARAFLIGESLMRQEDVVAATARLLANPSTGAMR